MDTRGWLKELFGAVDSFDIDKFATFLSDDVKFKFANIPATNGKAETKVFVGNFFGSIKGISHNVNDFWLQDDTVICHGTVTYTRMDETELAVPFANILKSNSGQIEEYLVYVDVSELYQPVNTSG